MSDKAIADFVEKLPKEKQQRLLDRIAKLNSLPKKELRITAKPKPR